MELPEADHHSHLHALHGLTSALRSWNNQFDQHAAEAAAYKPRNTDEEAQIIDIFYTAGFADLARSHAVVCTVSAFLESLFKSNLKAIGERACFEPTASHPRLVGLGGNRMLYWDLTRSGNNREGIADRIRAILSGARLLPYFGENFQSCVRAIFAYRNQMVHNGYEWPRDTRLAFHQQMLSEGWGEWFSVATSGDDPWYFTMTTAFEQACLVVCDRAVLAFEGLVIGDWQLYDFTYGDHNAHSDAPP